jgi:hypothetical protein
LNYDNPTSHTEFLTRPLSGTNIDTITDFSGDAIYLDQTIFSALVTPGPLSGSDFSSATTVSGTDAAFIKYDSDDGILYYDSNGSAGGGLTQFATLTGSPTLFAADFEVIT